MSCPSIQTIHMSKCDNPFLFLTKTLEMLPVLLSLGGYGLLLLLVETILLAFTS